MWFAGGLIADEERKTGAMSRAVYSFYLRQFTCSQILPLALLFALAQLCRFAMDAFLSRWAVGDPALVPEGLDPTIAYCIGYAILGVSTFVFSGLRYVWAQLIGLSASWKMHNLMLSNLLHAPVSFFDVTPIGRIGEPTATNILIPCPYDAFAARQSIASLAISPISTSRRRCSTIS